MRKWVRPSAYEECFASNENIANSVNACFSVYCMVAGDGKGGFKGNTYGSGKKIPWGIYQSEYYQLDGYQHGNPCAVGSSYNTATGKFYEYGKNIQAENIEINYSLGNATEGYQATWQSKEGTLTYKHYGYAINDQPNKPNHS